MRKLNLKDNKGFTIIEVLIVLAIAGLILIVVLLAVPALQRNGRNTTMKNDASAIAGGVNEFASNNNGKKVGTITVADGTVTVSGPTAAPGTPATAKVNGSTALTTPGGGNAPTPPAAGDVVIHIGYKCAQGTPPAGTEVANSRATAIYYSTETASGVQLQCLDS